MCDDSSAPPEEGSSCSDASSATRIECECDSTGLVRRARSRRKRHARLSRRRKPRRAASQTHLLRRRIPGRERPSIKENSAPNAHARRGCGWRGTCCQASRHTSSALRRGACSGGSTDPRCTDALRRKEPWGPRGDGARAERRVRIKKPESSSSALPPSRRSAAGDSTGSEAIGSEPLRGSRSTSSGSIDASIMMDAGRLPRAADS